MCLTKFGSIRRGGVFVEKKANASMRLTQIDDGKAICDVYESSIPEKNMLWETWDPPWGLLFDVCVANMFAQVAQHVLEFSSTKKNHKSLNKLTHFRISNQQKTLYILVHCTLQTHTNKFKKKIWKFLTSPKKTTSNGELGGLKLCQATQHHRRRCFRYRRRCGGYGATGWRVTCGETVAGKVRCMEVKERAVHN